MLLEPIIIVINLLNFLVVPDKFSQIMYESINVITLFCRLWQFVPFEGPEKESEF